MIHKINIGGRDVEFAWNKRAARLHLVRCSKADVEPFKLMAKPRTRIYGMAALLWSLLPDADYDKFKTPEDLFAEIDEKEWESEQTMSTFAGLFEDMAEPSDEKKSTLRKSPSPGSSSD